MKLFHILILIFFTSRVECLDSQTPPFPIGEIIQVDQGVYVARGSDDQFFILQKVSSVSNVKYRNWSQYGSELLSTFEVTSSTTGASYAKDAQNAIDVFLKCLRLAKDPKVDVWVAFSVDPKLLQAGVTLESLLNYTEMSFAVVTSKGVPVVQHFGIVRNPFYKGEKHSGMSVNLHAFAAAVMRHIDEKKLYMINIPLSYMRDTIQKALPEAATAVGVNNEKSWITIDEEGNFFLKD
jgi:hypothetical protein